MGQFRRPTLVPGLYDEIVTERVASELAQLDPTLEVVREALGKHATVATPLRVLLAEAIDLALDALKATPEDSIALTEEVLQVLARRLPTTFAQPNELRLTPERLNAITPKRVATPARPRGSLHASQLLVNAEGDSLLAHLRSEFASADQVDLLCSFVKLSGFEKLRAELEAHCVARGRPLRVLTTTYLGATDAKAVERMAALQNAAVRVSYDGDSTRLHAKAWIFHRRSGLTTAYVGSSNLSHAAQTDGLEWNVRLAATDQPRLVAQMSETFEQYWADADLFENYSRDDDAHVTRLRRAIDRQRLVVPREELLVELEPKPFQKPILEELAEVRRLGRHRNLLVAATGTGKTVMAALDYRELRASKAVDSLLFVAHRREILEQARSTYRHALGLRDFGELLVDGMRPEIGRHVFASIDSLSDDRHLDPGAFDMVVVDEAHHSAANSWTALLTRIRPRELLGLTGTPERADGVDYEAHFPRPWVGNLRVWNAIPTALVPFRYYMLDVQGVDLRDVEWRRGQYAKEELSGKLIGAAEVFVDRAARAVADFVGRPDKLRAIAFCVDIAHAEAVAAAFRRVGFAAQALTGRSPDQQRRDARSAIDSGSLTVLCVADLYNEGVDVPNMNAIFFFRPTESATVFLQQLGRGLRRTRDKDELVVFDLTGRQRLEFRFDRKLRALLGHTPRSLRELVARGFGRLPAGCHLHFDEVSRRDVLEQIERSIPSTQDGLVALLKEPGLRDLTLERFLHETDVALEDIYRKDRSWTALRQRAGLERGAVSTEEAEALANVHKLTHVGDALRLDTWARLVVLDSPTDERTRRVARMLWIVLYGKEIAADDARAWGTWSSHSILRKEIGQLIPVLRATQAVLSQPHELAPENPLVLHARYLSVELSAAFDHRSKAGPFRGFPKGVETVGGGKYDLLLTTLEKSPDVKAHLKYRDFPLEATRFHWQSMSSTTQHTREGRRHLDPVGEKCTSLLLVRETDKDARLVTNGFVYLGPVSPDSVEGERPLTIEWRLRYAMPAAMLQHGRIAA